MHERAVDDVGMPDHPADVGSGPPHFARIDAVEIFHRPFERDHVAAIVAYHALRPAGRARRVKNVERIGRRDRNAIIDRTGMDQRVIAHARPIMIAAGNHRRFGLRPLQDQTGAGLVCGKRDRFVEQRLIMHDAAGLDAAAGGEDHLRLGVVDAGRQFARGKAAEHHRMDSADAGAGEHGDDRLRHHRHIEDDAVAFFDAKIAQHGGEHLRLGQQPVIGDGALGAGQRRIVDDRRLVAASGIHLAVDGIEAGVAHAAGKPAAIDAGLRVEGRLRRFEPVDVSGRLGPKAFRITLPARVDLVIAA